MYEKHNWVNGEVITEDKLNHMEEGIANGGGGIFLIHDSGNTLDKTWNEIYDALNAGSLPLIINSEQAMGGNIFAYVGAIGQNGDTAILEFAHTVSCIPDNTEKFAYKNKELLYVQHEPETRELVQLSVRALIFSGANQSGLSASVYAICV